MTCRFRRAARAILCAALVATGILPQRATALDTPNVLMTIDGMTMLHQGLFRNAAQHDGFNTFQFGPVQFAAGTLGRYKSFFFIKNGAGDGGISHNARNHSDAPEVWTGSAFAPVEGVDLDTDYFPIVDRTTGGQLFDPNEYQIEVKFKPNMGVAGLPDNTAPLFNVGLDQTDGFVFDAEAGSYKRANDAFTYNIGSAENPINTWFATAPKDADGYATYTVPVSTPNFVQRGFYHAFGNGDFRTNSVVTGNGRMQGEDLVWVDANDGLDSLSFGGGPTGPTQQLKAPNGVPLISFGAPNAEAGLSLQVKYITLKKITPGQIVGRIDANSGLTFRFGSGFTYGATQPNINVEGFDFQPNATNQISRFDQDGMTNLMLSMRQPDNVGEAHRFVVRGGPSAESFDGSTATVNIRAKLLAGNTAANLVIVAKDLDGNDNAGNPLGADEYTHTLPLSQFNTSTFTTISVPLSSFALTMWGRAIYDDDPESPRLADEYGIVIGTSHHEPMMRAHVEWSRYGKGPWNYEKNRDRLREFWREGVARMGRHESVVTVGMRGDGDEPMSEKANIALLEKIITDQRGIIGEVTGQPPAETPQMWALYKEVQEYYDRGMRVPDDVMLLLCDDNWGNIRKLPKLGDKPRAAGYGVYYHFDYVGGPRNYKWLNTNSLPRVWEQMRLAYEYGAQQLWIVNVGDIKPMELPISFFLDYAWGPEAWPAERLPEYGRLWAEQQFGAEHAAEIADLLAKYAKYSARRKPELLEPGTYSLLHEREAERVVAEFNALAAEARRIGELLPRSCRDAYFQLVKFPIDACANLTELYVTAARNRLYAEQGRAATNELADRVEELFLRDTKLARMYNDDLADGKWRHMMDQTHIGYTNWQEPPRNVAPETKRIDVPTEASMGVSVEGSRAWWPRDDAMQRLAFTPYDSASSRRIEIFNHGQAAFDYQVACDAAWLQLDHPLGTVQDEARVEVSVDWSKAPEGSGEGTLTIVGADEESVVVRAVAAKPRAAEAGAIRGFVEAGGVIAIEAEHATRSVDRGPIRWQVIPDLGRTLSGVTATPVTAPRQTPGGDAPRLEYAIHLFNAGELRVQAYASPTLDFTAGDGRRYAISIDEAEPQIVNLNADDSLEAWERHVADNVNISETTHTVAAAGPHTLKFWMVDPGVVLQRLVIETGETRSTYMGPRESFLATGN